MEMKMIDKGRFAKFFEIGDGFRVLTTDALRLIIEANDHDPTEIGKEILKGYNKATAGS